MRPDFFDEKILNCRSYRASNLYSSLPESPDSGKELASLWDYGAEDKQISPKKTSYHINSRQAITSSDRLSGIYV